MKSKEYFAMIYYDMIRDKRLSGNDIRVWLELRTHANNKTLKCFVKHETVSAALGISYKTVARSVSELCDSGYLTKQRTRGACHYKLHTHSIPDRTKTPAQYGQKHLHSTDKKVGSDRSKQTNGTRSTLTTSIATISACNDIKDRSITAANSAAVMPAAKVTTVIDTDMNKKIGEILLHSVSPKGDWFAKGIEDRAEILVKLRAELAKNK